MSRGSDSLVALRDRAITGVEDLIAVLVVGRTLGIALPSDDDIRRPLRQVAHLDVGGLAADARRLGAVHRAVADQLHRLPEQQVRLDQGWSSGAGAAALLRVIDHQRRAETDLHALRSVAEAAQAAAAGVDQILRTWYLTVTRLSTPLVAGVPAGELGDSVLTGRIPHHLVAADLTARVDLLQRSATITHTGISSILTALVGTADGWETTVPDRPDRPRTTPPAPADLPRAAAPAATPAGAGASPGGPAGDDLPLTLAAIPVTEGTVTPSAPDSAAPPPPSAPDSAAPPPPVADRPMPGSSPPDPTPPGGQSASPQPAADLPDADLALAGDQ
ncbi:MAG: hypothetical protein QM662_13220 [Gordonia sp. (in: high G+C Gram-positive bacteria)]